MESREKLIFFYKQMLFLRRAEEAIGKLYTMQRINGFCHLYIGQEAIASGLYAAISPHDSVITSYRCHGLLLACGVELKVIIAELFGKASGISKGLGGSMHMFCKEKNFYGGHGIVGAQASLGTGIAFAYKYQNTDQICYCLMGEGALNQGQVYESFNMASLWNLPVIYIVENNLYAMGTHVNRGSVNSNELYKRGESFGIVGRKVDGMDVLAVRDAVKEASLYYCQHKKPMLLEIETYRYRGHSMSDPALYRTKEEVSGYRAKDPIEHVLKFILDKKFLTESDVEGIEDQMAADIQEAIAWAEKDGCLDTASLSDFVYSK